MEGERMGRIREFGSLYIYGAPVRSEDPLIGAPEIGIGNTVKYKPLRWIQAGCQFISESSILIRTSWIDLSTRGFAPGKTVVIDGVDFICRLPSLGTTADELSEWKMLAKTAQIEQCKNAPDFWFWGADELAIPGERPVGYLRDSDKWSILPEDSRANDIGQACGWRPILEPVGIELTDDLVGERITVWSGDYALSGTLLELLDYDVILGNVLSWPLIEEPRERFFKSMKNRIFAVNREAVTLAHRWVRGMLDT